MNQDEAVPTLVLRGLTKRFAGVCALDQVDLDIRPGEVHGLLGENGSGKSTLIKVLAGFHDVDEGELEIHGEPIKLPMEPGQFRALGLDFVHQDLGLIDSISVMENLRIGELTGSRWRISWKRERRRAREVFATYGIDLDPDAKVSEIRPVQRAQLAIARAVEGMRQSLAESDSNRGLLVLDEPTVFLPRTEVDHLFRLIREIAATGASVLFVSHDLDEVRRITDRVTVLRDGRLVDTVDTDSVDETRLVEMIIGRQLAHLMVPDRDTSAATDHGAVATINGVTGGTLRDVSFSVRRGEVLGVTGLVGSGFEEIAYFLFGAEPVEAGELVLDGRTHDLRSMTPARAMRAGIALIPADRQADAAVGTLSVVDNITLPVLDRYASGPHLNRGRMAQDAARLTEQFDVRPREPWKSCASLSGGNQQKVVLAKWFQMDPTLLLLHEPTQGVDVGARQQIFQLIRAPTEEDKGVICASSDYEQLAAVCDRVLVFGRGRIVQQLEGDDVTKERITEQCYNSVSWASSDV
jgi:ribose transport system ATP-binding protein